MTNDIDSSNIDVHLPEKDGDNFDAESKVNPQNPLKNSENSEDLSETAKTFGVEKAAVVDSSQKQKDKHQSDDKKKKTVKKKYNLWWLKVTIISFFLAGFFSFLSELTATSEHIVVTLLLLGFLILASILFDAIGVEPVPSRGASGPEDRKQDEKDQRTFSFHTLNIIILDESPDELPPFELLLEEYDQFLKIALWA